MVRKADTPAGQLAAAATEKTEPDTTSPPPAADPAAADPAGPVETTEPQTEPAVDVPDTPGDDAEPVEMTTVADPPRFFLSEGVRNDLEQHGEAVDPMTGHRLVKDKDTGEITLIHKVTGERRVVSEAGPWD